MYTEYFKLAEHPFKILSDPRYLWYSEQHLEAKQKIQYHITQSAGPIYLLAAIGTGKSTLARRIASELSSDQRMSVGLVFTPPQPLTTKPSLRTIMNPVNVKS